MENKIYLLMDEGTTYFRGTEGQCANWLWHRNLAGQGEFAVIDAEHSTLGDMEPTADVEQQALKMVKAERAEDVPMPDIPMPDWFMALTIRDIRNLCDKLGCHGSSIEDLWQDEIHDGMEELVREWTTPEELEEYLEIFMHVSQVNGQTPDSGMSMVAAYDYFLPKAINKILNSD